MAALGSLTSQQAQARPRPLPIPKPRVPAGQPVVPSLPPLNPLDAQLVGEVAFVVFQAADYVQRHARNLQLLQLVQGRVVDGFFKRLVVSKDSVRDCLLPLIKEQHTMTKLDFTFCQVEDDAFEDIVKASQEHRIQEITVTRLLTDKEEEALIRQSATLAARCKPTKNSFIRYAVNPWNPHPFFRPHIDPEYFKPIDPRAKLPLALFAFRISEEILEQASNEKGIVDYVMYRRLQVRCEKVEQRAPIASLPLGQVIDGRCYTSFALEPSGIKAINSDLSFEKFNAVRTGKESVKTAASAKVLAEQDPQQLAELKKGLTSCLTYFIQDNLKEFRMNPKLLGESFNTVSSQEAVELLSKTPNINSFRLMKGQTVLDSGVYSMLKVLFQEHPLTSPFPYKVFSLEHYHLQDYESLIRFLRDVPQISCVVVGWHAKYSELKRKLQSAGIGRSLRLTNKL